MSLGRIEREERLGVLRREIDDIDGVIVALLNLRYERARDARDIRRERSTSARDPEREREITVALAKKSTGYRPSTIAKIWECFFEDAP